VKLGFVVFVLLTSGVHAEDSVGICKGDAVPPGRVIVTEFDSGQCNSPGTKNAWDTVVPVDGTTVCLTSPFKRFNAREMPRKADANILQFVACEKVDSSACPLFRDGQQNAIVLRTPEHCLASTSSSKLLELSLKCDVQDKAPKPDESYDIAIGRVSPAPRGCASTAFVMQHLPPHQSLSDVVACVRSTAPFNPIGTTWQIFDTVVRRFRDKNCPDETAAHGPSEGYNAIVFHRSGQIGGESVCEGSPILDVGRTLDQSWPNSYFEGNSTDDCGNTQSYKVGKPIPPTPR
jgi:hypothetical protein